MPYSPDEIDRRILVALQRNGRISNIELAREIGLTPTPCLRRVRQLEEAGIIDEYVALLNPVKMGFTTTVFVRVWLDAQDEDTVSHFVKVIQASPEVVECHLMAGDCDFLLRVLVKSLEAYRHFQSEYLARIKGVRSLKTDIPMQKVKLSWKLPL
ncbi:MULTISPECIES: Lrp/AsnC family transcriptional regulator [Acetobacter]|uniref:Lrp/AsnC family transcriptional regulator n=1 Tax=Acetobacter thailandicus TaxID=1502842 RepID=A0ABT3QAZ7_9PROT|nr:MULTISPECIES: Lrp/AsnC family transcriptional regulator [Acetobacter]MBS0959361.1 Lrp/AsnC family transcriptional regulator [Acetobacter thailandicus]MBS0980548.1 Lrp/AsnC family transcriptional regulator [Acetobacter thailandicus]MBS0984746.1 Lrp/AsnC family transcriptional regulator [Acetobacter thailandicus]MBS1003735.1 Lrp/AsnC family transcriptional regulator [Acetobacter thailandicus]MCX2562455.1 Lrp/AsnC family transcriptional regulator [Acetobacter thailandicus]